MPAHGENPAAPRLRQRCWSPVFGIPAILTGVRWCLTVILIGVSVTRKDTEHLVTRPFVTCTSSSMRGLFAPVGRVISSRCFLAAKFESSMRALDNSLLPATSFASIFFPSVAYFPILCTAPFRQQKFLTVMKANIIFLRSMPLVSYLKSRLQTQDHLDFLQYHLRGGE